MGSPLNAYTSYDGLSKGGGDTIDVMLNKIAGQIGMTIHPVLMDDVMKNWLDAARNHSPEPFESNTQLQPEQIGVVEGLISRLESSVQALETRRAPTPAAAPTTTRRRTPPRHSRVARRLAVAEAEAAGRESVMFPEAEGLSFIRSFDELRAFVHENPDVEVHEVDGDGDLRLTDSEGDSVFLRGDWVESLPDDDPEDGIGAVLEGIRGSLLADDRSWRPRTPRAD